MSAPYSDADAAFDYEQLNGRAPCPRHGTTRCECCTECGRAKGREHATWCRTGREELSPAELVILDHVGDCEAADLVELAILALDQAGVGVQVQAEIRRVLARAGLVTESEVRS